MARFGKSSLRRKIRPNFLYSIISVALVLIIAGLFSLVVLHGQGLVRKFKEQVTVLIEINPTVEQSGIDSLGDYLSAQRWVKIPSVKFVSKDVALEELQEEFEYIMQMDLPNPLFHMYEFNVNADYLQTDSLAMVRQSLIALEEVQDVYYQQSIVDGLSRNLQDIGLIALSISAVLLLIAITLIYNTIKLSLYSNRFIIKNMQLVGASWSHISRPYLQRSALHGIASAIIATVALLSGLSFLYQRIPEIQDVVGLEQLFFVFLGLVCTGIVINLTSTFYTISRFLSMRTDDLY